MARKSTTLTDLDQDLAEVFLGPSRGRPTISRRAGRHLGRALDLDARTGTDLFHAALVFGLGAIVVKTLKSVAEARTW